jgi:hypothetical protein
MNNPSKPTAILEPQKIQSRQQQPKGQVNK